MFFNFDSIGELLPCKDTQLLKELIVCKKSVNFHIKMWVDGYFDFLEPVSYYLNEFINPPDWAEKALRKQVGKWWYKLSSQEKQKLIFKLVFVFF